MCTCKVLTYELIIKSVYLIHNHPPDPLLAIEYGGDLDSFESENIKDEEFNKKLEEARAKQRKGLRI